MRASIRFVLCCVLLTAPLAAFGQVDHADKGWDPDSMDELPAQIEESIRQLVDKIQQSVQGAVQSVSSPLDKTLELTFEVSGLSGPIRVLCATSTYTVDVRNDRAKTSAVGQPAGHETYELLLDGTVKAGDKADTYLVTYGGRFKVEKDDETPGGTTEKADMDLRGSALMTLGKERTLAQNGEWTLTLTVTEANNGG